MMRSKWIMIGMAGCALAGGIWWSQTAKPRAEAKAAASQSQALLTLPAGGASQTDQQISKWQNLIRLNPKDPLGWVSLGDVLMQKGRETADASYYTHAERAYTKALEQKANHIDALHGLAWVYSVRHEFEKSIEWARKVIAADPKNNLAYGLLGDAAVEMGQYEQALDHYQKMLDLRPDISSYSRGAHLLWLTGDIQSAGVLMAKAIKVGAPYGENTAWCRAQLAMMYFHNGLLIPAEKFLEQSLKQTPNNYHLLLTMGKFKAARKDYTAAIESLKKAIAIAPQHEALVALGDLYTLTGKKTEAEQQFAQVEAMHQLLKANGVQGDSQMARFYADHDRNLPEALAMAQEEYKTRPNVYVMDTLAWTLYKNGRYAEARDLIEKALKRKTPDPSLYFHAGMIYAKMGRIAPAQTYLSKALNLNPNFHPLDARAAQDAMERLARQPHNNTVVSQNSNQETNAWDAQFRH
jgi:tetratricopeptide (TPR) repeat protein